MRSLTLTAPTGAPVSINPLHLVTWGSAIIKTGGAEVLGSMVVLAVGAGGKEVLESREQIDWAFAQAMAKTDDADLAVIIAAVRAAITPPPPAPSLGPVVPPEQST